MTRIIWHTRRVVNPSLEIYRIIAVEPTACTTPLIKMFTLGHGHFDLNSYEKFLSGKMEDIEPSDADLKKALAELTNIG